MLFLLLSLKCRDGLRFTDEPLLLCGFYNMDNLYDTLDDAASNDADFTPEGAYRWTTERYAAKISAMGRVISDLSEGFAPDILGMCEVENRMVMEDLLRQMNASGQYGLVHYDSEDERGSDVALIFNNAKLKLLDSKPFPVRFEQDSSDRTRDILWAKLASNSISDTLHLFVCHFPSRRGGVAQSEPKRLQAAKVLKKAIAAQCKRGTEHILVCGDFNDEPENASLQKVLAAGSPEKAKPYGLYNLMRPLQSSGSGTYRYKGQWNLLDQFIVSGSLLDGFGTDLVPGSLRIKQEPWMIQSGKYKGYPLRTFGGKTYLNGYSDHFPIHITLSMKEHGKK